MSLNVFDRWILWNYDYLQKGMTVSVAKHARPRGMSLKLFRVCMMDVCNKIRPRTTTNICGRIYVYKLKPEFAERYARLRFLIH